MKLTNEQAYALAWMVNYRGYDLVNFESRHKEPMHIPASIMRQLENKGLVVLAWINFGEDVGRMRGWVLTEEAREIGQTNLFLLSLEAPGKALQRMKQK